MLFQEKIDSKANKMKNLFLNTKNTSEYEYESNKLRYACENFLETKKDEVSPKSPKNSTGNRSSNNRNTEGIAATIVENERENEIEIMDDKISNLLDKWEMGNDGLCVFFKRNRFEIVSKKVQKFSKMKEIEAWLDYSENKINYSKLLPWTMVNVGSPRGDESEVEEDGINSPNSPKSPKSPKSARSSGYGRINNYRRVNKYLSMKCSVTMDYIDPTQGIMDNGEIIGYKKLQTKRKIGLTFIALHLRDKFDISKKEFILVTFHLNSNKNATGEKIRLAQIEAMLGLGPYLSRYDSINNNNNNNNKEQMRFDARPIIKNPKKLPVLICCDLNGTSKDTMFYDAKSNKLIKKYGFECYQRLTNKDNNNGLGFESMYKKAIRNNNLEPNYTTWKTRYPSKDNNINTDNDDDDITDKHTIDYILSKGDRWHITHYLDLPQSIGSSSKFNRGANDSGVIKSPLPDWHYPSDHLSLVMRLEWKD